MRVCVTVLCSKMKLRKLSRLSVSWYEKVWFLFLDILLLFVTSR